MKALKEFRLITKYLKGKKLKVTTYIICTVLISFIPVLSSYFFGAAIEYITKLDYKNFLLYLIITQSLNIITWTVIELPRRIIYNNLQKDFERDVSIDLYKKISDLEVISFEQKGVGEFTNRLTSDPKEVFNLLQSVVRLISKLLVAFVIMIFAFKIHWALGSALVLFAMVMFTISKLMYPKIKAKAKEIKAESDKAVKELTENITGIREIKALGIKENVSRKLNQTIASVMNRNREQNNFEIKYYAFNNLAFIIFEFICLFVAGKLLIAGIITVTAFIMTERNMWRIDDAVESLSEIGVQYNKVIVSMKRINDILEDREFNEEKFGKKELKEKDNITIKFKNVKFRYTQEDNLTLKGLNLELNPHQKIAIVGKSGQGKSTIFNLLLRFFDVNEGTITLNGINIKDLTEDSLRNNVSVIRQSPFLFNLTVKENFEVVKPDVTLDEIRTACREAYIDDYIMSLPKGYDTLIGEGGINLSGGQKQRLAIARALLKNSKVILFDEATSALDNTSQKYIKETIDNLVKDHTVIVVAHRLSTIIDADIINVIDDGILLAKGTHQELLSTCEMYKELYEKDEKNEGE